MDNARRRLEAMKPTSRSLFRYRNFPEHMTDISWILLSQKRLLSRLHEQLLEKGFPKAPKLEVH